MGQVFTARTGIIIKQPGRAYRSPVNVPDELERSVRPRFVRQRPLPPLGLPRVPPHAMLVRAARLDAESALRATSNPGPWRRRWETTRPPIAADARSPPAWPPQPSHRS